MWSPSLLRERCGGGEGLEFATDRSQIAGPAQHKGRGLRDSFIIPEAEGGRELPVIIGGRTPGLGTRPPWTPVRETQQDPSVTHPRLCTQENSSVTHSSPCTQEDPSGTHPRLCTQENSSVTHPCPCTQEDPSGTHPSLCTQPDPSIPHPRLCTQENSSVTHPRLCTQENSSITHPRPCTQENSSIPNPCPCTQEDPSVTHPCQCTKEDHSVPHPCQCTQEDPSGTHPSLCTQPDPSIPHPRPCTQENSSIPHPCPCTQQDASVTHPRPCTQQDTSVTHSSPCTQENSGVTHLRPCTQDNSSVPHPRPCTQENSSVPHPRPCTQENSSVPHPRPCTQEDPSDGPDPRPCTQEDPSDGPDPRPCTQQGPRDSPDPRQEADQDCSRGPVPRREEEQDPTEAAASLEERGGPGSGAEDGHGRPVTRRLTYIIRSRGHSGRELTSFAEQRQLQLQERRRGRGGRGPVGFGPDPEWGHVRQRLQLKQTEIRARLQAREAWLGRRWQSLGRRAYTRLLRLAGREGEEQACGPGSCGARLDPWENAGLGHGEAPLGERVGEMNGEGEAGGEQLWTLTPSGARLDLLEAPGLGMGPLGEAERRRGTEVPPDEETAGPGCQRAQQEPSIGGRRERQGDGETKETEVISQRRPRTRLLARGPHSSPQKRGEGRREQTEPGAKQRSRRDCERITALPSTESSGLKLFKEPSTKSNRLILHNALTYCCLAGKVNETQRDRVIEELMHCTHAQCLILFRDHRCQFRALYSLSADTGDIQRLWGNGPKLIRQQMIEGLYKYNSDHKQFHLIPSKILSPNVDALTIHGQLWSGRRRPGPSADTK